MSGAHLSRDDCDLFYTIHGPSSGLPVLLIHGWTCDMTDWSFQLPFLLQTHKCFRVIAMDLRGHGASRTLQADGHTETDMSPTAMAEDAAEILRRSGVDDSNKAIIIAHSLGTTVGIELSHGHPSLVKGLVLLDPSYQAPLHMFLGLVEQLKDDYETALASCFEALYPSETPEYIKTWNLLRALSMDKGAAIRSVEQQVECLLPSGVEYARRTRVKVPRLVMSSAGQFLDAIREAGWDDELDRLELLEAGGHWMMKTKPDEVNRLIQSWLEGRSFIDTP
ncbi:Alpha/Beta hydrolase protein [Microdochium trichocladiopsis]|uniref:Alpha/Beta hydrolase protein n=1 Tax=Microdochium trichocladiopsis TaxID=1682393 RepID=A0A9P8XUK4_9PEZI|nr:Alpha/Beta hydrolase protein [Microdochium trichocladiopsis]KAH7018399.1 Alpha/Beta hydrolase protein [Microdochium trichocladiopsis]